MTFPDIQTLVAIVTGIVALIIAWRKSGPDLRKANAEAADIYQSIAAEQAKHYQELEIRMEAKIKTMDKKLEELVVEDACKEGYIQELTAYVDKLIEIMEKAGLIVPERPARKGRVKIDKS